MTTQVGEKGQLRESTAALEATEKKMAETVAQFIADQTQKLAEAERKRDRLAQELIKASSKNERSGSGRRSPARCSSSRSAPSAKWYQADRRS